MDTIRLFVYGIFLSQRNRERYFMVDAEYTTVRGLKTVGDYIVQATFDTTACLTGVTVTMPVDKLDSLDALERGYKRIEVLTTDNEVVDMYIAPESAKPYSEWASKRIAEVKNNELEKLWVKPSEM